MLILGKKSCFKEPTIFEVPQPQGTEVVQSSLHRKNIGKDFTQLNIYLVLGVDCDLPQPWTPYYWPYVVDFCICLGSNSLLT